MTVDSFFTLPGEPTNVDQDAFLKLVENGGDIRSKIYEPSFLKSPAEPQRWTISDCKFVEVSFAKTFIEGFEFKNCIFSACLFMGSIFKDCRFTACTFTNCNTYRIEFIDVYLNPRSFDGCLDKKRHQNIGVYLYQELLSNSRRQSQPDFTHDALFQFRRWLRFENIYRLKQPGETFSNRARLAIRIVQSLLSQLFLGFGIRVRHYISTAALAALFFSSINYHFWQVFGLKPDPPPTFVDALYFTIITLTTVGYGDITPAEPLGRIVVAAEALCGFVLFAILASMVYRKILP